MINMTTIADIVLITFEVLLGFGLYIIYGVLSKQGDALKMQGEAIAGINAKLDGLPLATLQADIQSNRHRINQMDRDMATLIERQNQMDKRCERMHRAD